MIDLKELRRLAEAATPGNRVTYEDTDYYRGGLYLGVGPQKYVPNTMGEYVDCEAEEATSLKKNIAILESEDEDTDYLTAVSNPALIIGLLDRLDLLESKLFTSGVDLITSAVDFMRADKKSLDEKAWSLGFGLALAGNDAEAITKRLDKLEREHTRLIEVLKAVREFDEYTTVSFDLTRAPKQRVFEINEEFVRRLEKSLKDCADIGVEE